MGWGVSGGHTAEMMRILDGVDFERYSTRIYLISSGDLLSETKALSLEKKIDSGSVCPFCPFVACSQAPADASSQNPVLNPPHPKSKKSWTILLYFDIYYSLHLPPLLLPHITTSSHFHFANSPNSKAASICRCDAIKWTW